MASVTSEGRKFSCEKKVCCRGQALIERGRELGDGRRARETQREWRDSDRDREREKELRQRGGGGRGRGRERERERMNKHFLNLFFSQLFFNSHPPPLKQK